jgi:flagellar hook protein FlgE
MDVTSIALGGLQNAEGMLEKSANRIANLAAPQFDPATDTVELISARQQYQANARVIHVGDDMQKKLLNLLA